jgi:hypothetical protein
MMDLCCMVGTLGSLDAPDFFLGNGLYRSCRDSPLCCIVGMAICAPAKGKNSD